MTLAKQALRQATEAQDAEAIAAATEALTLATTDKARLQQYSQAQKQYEEQEAAYQANQQNQQQYQAPEQYAQPAEEYNEPSPKAREWAKKNTWFGQDQVATSVAFAVHKQLENEGFDTDSDEYYSEIDKRVQQELPHKFNVEAKKNVQTVASATRNTSTGRKQNRIQLTPSEQALAKKLGVSFKDYAIQKARLQKS